MPATKNKPTVCQCCGQVFNPDNVVWNAELGILTDHGHDIKFPKVKARFINTLYHKMGSTVSKEKLHYEVYGYPEDGGVEMKTIDTIIYFIRQKLKGSNFEIKNIFAVGYYLKYTPPS